MNNMTQLTQRAHSNGLRIHRTLQLLTKQKFLSLLKWF